jgi:hypothetical protein
MASKKEKMLAFGPTHEEMMVILESSAGNVTTACQKMKISRQTHYNWLDRVDGYKKRFDNIQESILDFAESQLMKNIKDGKETSLIFLLKTKGKNRGYIERQEIDHSSSDGSMKPPVSLDVSKLSDKALNEIMSLKDATTQQE